MAFAFARRVGKGRTGGDANPAVMSVARPDAVFVFRLCPVGEVGSRRRLEPGGEFHHLGEAPLSVAAEPTSPPTGRGGRTGVTAKVFQRVDTVADGESADLAHFSFFGGSGMTSSLASRGWTSTASTRVAFLSLGLRETACSAIAGS